MEHFLRDLSNAWRCISFLPQYVQAKETLTVQLLLKPVSDTSENEVFKSFLERSHYDDVPWATEHGQRDHGVAHWKDDLQYG